MEFFDSNNFLLFMILLAGLYMAWNIGANDVANAMGTSVGSGALTLKKAVLIAAVLEFSGAFFFGSHVSETVQKRIINPEIFASDPRLLVYGMLASLIAAGAWLQVASYYGWPVSTTHSIVGSVVGFGAVIGGVTAIQWGNVAYILSSWVLSPLLGGAISYVLFVQLRKQIFYARNPIAAAKKITPYLVFFVTAILTLILFYKGVGKLSGGLTSYQTFGLSLAVGLLSAFISFLWVRTIQAPIQAVSEPVIPSEVLHGLNKAKKHLARVQNASMGQTRYQVSNLLNGVETLASSLEPEITFESSRSDFEVVERIFGYLQILSASMMAFAHGANDVANAIGPIAAAFNILTDNPQAVGIPTWLLALGGVGIIVGLATWGWRVIETIGKKITELTPSRGFTAEFGAALTILVASRMGLPVSTTHTLVGSVVGVGLARGIEALDLSMTRDIVLSWVVTVPAGAVLAIGISYAFTIFLG